MRSVFKIYARLVSKRLGKTVRGKNNKIESEDILIGKQVWDGANAIILKATSIGDNSIISTGTIVTKNIGSNSIAAGIAAKVIKTNTTWLRDTI